MKKIVAIALLFSMGVSSYAQISDVFRLGLSASPFVSFLGSNDPLINPAGSNVGFHLGMDAELYFGPDAIDAKNYAITTGFGIVFNTGGALTHDIGGELWKSGELRTPLVDASGNVVPMPNGATLGYKVQTLRIPIGIKMRTNEIGYFRYFGHVPFFLDVATAARGTVESSTVNTDKPQNINKDVNPLNLSWGIGGGAEYSLSTGTSVTAALFFHNGFLDVTNNKGQQNSVPTVTEEDSKTIINAITLKLGFLF